MGRGVLCFSLLMACVHGVVAFDWTTSVNNGSEQTACVGDTFVFPWSYTKNDSERLLDVEWYSIPENGTRLLLATLVSGYFVLSPTTHLNLTHESNASLAVHGLSAADTGNYSVVVNYVSAGKSTSATQMLRLLVAIAPELDSGRLVVQQLPGHSSPSASLSPLHAQLSCGQFVNLGQPPVSVTWLTPSGNTTTSTSSNNGTFFLSLKNPIEGGNYTCMILASASATCGARNNTQNASSFQVDGTATRLQIIEERLSVLEQHLNLTVKDFNSQDDLLKTLTDLNDTLNDWVQQSEFNVTGQLLQVREDLADVKVDNSNLTKTVNDILSKMASATLERDALNTGIVQLSENISDISAQESGRQTGLEKQLQKMVDAVYNLTSHSSALDNRVLVLAEQVTNLTNANADLLNKLDHQQLVNSNVTLRIHTLEQEIDSLRSNNSMLDQYINSFEEKMTNSTFGCQQLKDDMAELVSDVSNLTSYCTNMQSQLNAGVMACANISQSVVALTSNLSAVKLETDNLTRAVDDLNRETKLLASHTANVTATVENVYDDVRNLTANSLHGLIELNGQTVNVSQQVEGLRKQVEDLAVEKDQLEEHVQNITSVVNSLRSDIDIQESGEEELRGQVRDMTRNLTAVSGEVAQAAVRIDGLLADYENITNYLQVVQTQLLNLTLDMRDPEDKLDLQDLWNRTYFSQLRNLTSSFHQFGFDLESMKANQANVSSHVQSLESERSWVRTMVESLGSQVAPLVTQHMNMTEHLSGLQQQVTSLTTSFQQLHSDVQQQHGNWTKLEKQVNILVSANDWLKSQQTNLNNLEQSLKEQLQNLTSDFQKIHDNMSVNSLEDSRVAGKVQTIVGQVQNITSWITSATDLMTKLDKQAAVLTLEGAGVKEELDNLTAGLATGYQNLQLLTAAQDNDTLHIQALEGVISNLSRTNINLSFASDELSVKLQQLTDTLQRARELQDTIRRPASCDDVQQYDLFNGLHTLYLSGDTKIPVYCDQTTDQGGWTVIQRRQDGSVDFYRTWEDYQKGFGDLTANFWLGLNNIHLMTSQRDCSLRIDMRDFHGNTSYAKYGQFRVADVTDLYRLHVQQFIGSAGDSLQSPINGDDSMAFSTFDRDNDIYRSNCAHESFYAGGWWYAKCGQANLNGVYKYGGGGEIKGIFWYTWTNSTTYLSHVEMKIKCQSTESLSDS